MKVIHQVVKVYKYTCESDIAIDVTGNRAFSTSERLKTYIAPSEYDVQERFAKLTMIHIHFRRTEKLELISVANEFMI